MDLHLPSESGARTPAIDFIFRIALIFGLAWVCYRVISPFLTLAIWSIVFAVTLYPLHQAIARRVWNKQWLASLILVVISVLLIVGPIALLLNSFADSIRGFVTAIQDNTFQIPPPRESVQGWPVIGETVYEQWTKIYQDLPGELQRLQPKMGELARAALTTVAGIGTTVLVFLASVLVSSVIMAYAESAHTTTISAFVRIAGPDVGQRLVKLATATIRTVALGVIGVAAIQALLVGLALLLAGVPAAGVLAAIVLILGIAQIPSLVVVLPAIIYIWTSGTHETTSAVIFTVVLLLTGLADNFLKPLLLGRGVDVPMPVILFGALGGMASGGILGMFVGATALALAYVIFIAWLSEGRSDSIPADDDIVVSEPSLVSS